MVDVSEILRFYEVIHTLKHKPRQGWVNRNVPGVQDTIASHSFGSFMLAFVSGGACDTSKVMNLLAVHDLIMNYIEDLTPDRQEYRSKRELERMAIDKLLADVPAQARDELNELVLEYIGQETEESRLAKEYDKLDTLLQARKYAELTGKDYLSEFIGTYKSLFKSELGRQILDYLSKNLQ